MHAASRTVTIQEHQFYQDEKTHLSMGYLEQLPVEVLNGFGESWTELALNDQINSLGMRVVVTGNAAHFNYKQTQLIAWHGNSTEAQYVADCLSIPYTQIQLYQRQDKPISYTVVTGSDLVKRRDQKAGLVPTMEQNGSVKAPQQPQQPQQPARRGISEQEKTSFLALSKQELNALTPAKNTVTVEVLKGAKNPVNHAAVLRTLKTHSYRIITGNAGHFNYETSSLISWKQNAQGALLLAQRLGITTANIYLYDRQQKSIAYTVVLGKKKLQQPIVKKKKKVHKVSEVIDYRSLTIDQLYEQLFGKKKPASVAIDLEVNGYVDTLRKGRFSIRTNSDSEWFKMKKSDFFMMLRPHIKKKILANLEQELETVQMVTSEWITESAFDYVFKASETSLELIVPADYRAYQLIDFTGRGFLQSHRDDLELSFFSAYSNIKIERESLYFSRLATRLSNDRIEIDNHIGLGDVFIDSSVHSNNDWYFNHLEANSLFKTKTLFVRAGFLQDDDVFGIDIGNTFIHSISDQYKRKPTRKFKINEPVTVEGYVNGRREFSKQLVPGKYKLKNLPTPAGPNKVQVRIKGKNVTKDITYFDYNTTQLLSFLDARYNILYGRYDQRHLNTFDINARLKQDHSVYRVNTELGLGNMGMLLSNITAGYTLESTQRALQVYTGRLKGGISSGIVELSYAQSKHPFRNKIGTECTLEYKSLIFSKHPVINQWQASLTLANTSYQPYSMEPSLTVSKNNSALHSMTVLFNFKPLPYLNNPATFSFNYTFKSQAKTKLSTFFSSSYEIKKNIDARFMVGYEYHNQHALNVNFSVNYAFETEQAVIVGSVNGDGDELMYRNNVGFKQGSEFPVKLVLDKSSFTASYQKKGPNIINNVMFRGGRNGESLLYEGAFESTRGLGLFSFSNQLSGVDQNLYSRSYFIIRTSVAAVGKHVAFGRHIENKSFAIIDGHRLLKKSEVVFSETQKLNQWGPALINTVSPFSLNTISGYYDTLPEGVDLLNAALEFKPKYGRGYYKKIGKESPVIVKGVFIDQNGEPVALRYIRILDNTKKEQLFFTNSRGEFTLFMYRGGSFLLEIVGHSSKKLNISIDEDEKFQLDLGVITFAREL